MDSLFDRIVASIRENQNFASVFTPDVVDELAGLSEKEYETLKLYLEAHLVMNQVEGFDLRNLDKLVLAARARLEERRSRLPLVPLAEQLPDAPHAGSGLMVPPGWLLSADGVFFLDAQGSPRCRVCTAPVYAAEKRLDPDRRKALVTVVVKSGNWHTTAVPLSSGGRRVAVTVADMGALVLDVSLLKGYWDAFLTTNWAHMPLNEGEGSLYEDLVAFVTDNLHRFTQRGDWGKVVDGKDGAYVAIDPGVVRKFARSAGVDYDHLLVTLREGGHLLTDGRSRYKTVWFKNQARRMVALTWDPLANERPAERSA